MSNQPATLNALSAGTPQEDAAAILNHPLYEKADKFSFSLATTGYPASGGKHIVPVGNYLLLKTMNAMEAAQASAIRLDSFKSECSPKGTFMPEVVCVTDYRISFTSASQPKVITGHTETNIGNWLVKDDSFVGMTHDYGSSGIVEQVRKAVDAVGEDISKKAAAS